MVGFALAALGLDAFKDFLAVDRDVFSAEVEAALQSPVVKRLCALIRLRNSHPAFNGTFSMPVCTDTALTLRWDLGADSAELYVDFGNDSCLLRLCEAGELRELDIEAVQ